MLGPLAASAAPGAVWTAAGLLGGPTTPEGAHSCDGEVGLLLAVLEILGSCSKDGKQLLMVVDGRCAPVGLVGQGADVLMVVFSELKVDSGRETAQQQHGEEGVHSSPGWTSSSISERS